MAVFESRTSDIGSDRSTYQLSHTTIAQCRLSYSSLPTSLSFYLDLVCCLKYDFLSQCLSHPSTFCTFFNSSIPGPLFLSFRLFNKRLIQFIVLKLLMSRFQLHICGAGSYCYPNYATTTAPFGTFLFILLLPHF